MLLQEEQYIIKWLSQYRTLETRQLYLLLHDSTEAFVKRTLHRLVKDGYIFERLGFISNDPDGPVNQKMINAVWELIQYAEQIHPLAHYPAEYPAQIFFLKGNTGYEIIVVERNELHLVRLLQPEPDIKYIIVLPDIALAEQVRLPDAPCLFATVEHDAADTKVKFYTGGYDDA